MDASFSSCSCSFLSPTLQVSIETATLKLKNNDIKGCPYRILDHHASMNRILYFVLFFFFARVEMDLIWPFLALSWPPWPPV